VKTELRKTNRQTVYSIFPSKYEVELTTIILHVGYSRDRKGYIICYIICKYMQCQHCKQHIPTFFHQFRKFIVCKA